MRSHGKLYRFYLSDLIPEIAELELERKKIVKKLIPVALVIAGIVIAISIFIFELMFLFFAVAVAITGFSLITRKMSKDFSSDFKQRVIKKIVAFIDPDLTYEASLRVSERLFVGSQIYRRAIDIYKGDDYVSGSVGATKIEFSELHAQYITRDGKGRKHDHTLFKGLFFSADFNKNFHGKTFVLPDRAERILGQIGSTLQGLNGQYGDLVKLENVDFEKAFVVYADDQIEARYILSPALMERIVNLQKKSKKRISISFVGSRVNIAIPFTKNLFEPKIFSTILDFKSVRDYYDNLVLMIDIVEDLNLNTRIWTKR